MQIAPFDIYGTIVFLGLTIFFYKRGWFFSFYSFFKFILIFVLSLGASLYLSSHNSISLPVTKLEQQLLIQGIFFIIMWKFINFKWLFFKSTDGIFKLNRFIFFHHIDKLLNIFPSAVASFFVSFFVFTVLITASSNNIYLARQIESSKIVKPLSYQIYFASVSKNPVGLFQGVAYRIVPAFNSLTKTTKPTTNQDAANNFREQVNQQRAQAGISPLAGAFTFSPEPDYGPDQPTQYFVPETTTPQQPSTNNNQQQQAPPQAAAQPTTPPVPNTPTPYPTVAPIVVPIFFQPTAIPQPTTTSIMQPTPISQQPVIQPTTPPIQPTREPTNPPPPISAPAANISQVEQDLFNLTNKARAENGLPPLAWDNNIAAVARAHSQDMEKRNFFDHVNPDGLDPFQRLHIGGITWTAAGENIAAGPSADIIMNKWLNSSGHRANILNSSFGKIGIGVSPSSQYGYFATQDFTN